MFHVSQPTARPRAEDAPEFELSPDVVLLSVDDGSSRLLDLNGDFHALGAVGTRMLEGVQASGRESTVQALAIEYGVDSNRIRHDLDALLDSLRAQGLIHGPRARAARQRGRRWAKGLIDVLMRLIYATCSSWRMRAAAILTLSRLSFATFGWAHSVAAFDGTLARFRRPVSEAGPSRAADEIDRIVRQVASKHGIGMACKERALTCWVLLRSLGVEADLVVGLSLVPLAGHCWCESGSRTLSDDDDRCTAFQSVIRYA